MKINLSEENKFGKRESAGSEMDIEHDRPTGVVTIKKGDSVISMSEGAFCVMYEDFKNGKS